MRHCELLIDGHFIGGPCDQAIGKDVIRSPYSGEIVGTAAEGGFDEVRTAIHAAHDAFASWQHRSTAERSGLLLRISEAVRERSGELAELLTDEVGKPITWSRAEVERLAVTFAIGAKEALRLTEEEVALGDDARGQDYLASVRRVPLGVVFAIVPYNWPFNLAAHKLAPALASGNTIVLKPSPLAPLSTLTLARLIHECGCPAGVVNAVNAPPKAVERALPDPRVKMLSFTGSARVGWALKQLLGDRKVTLELGGDAFAIVCDDADLDWAVSRIVPGAFGYAGQICISIQHVLVQASVAEAFRERLVEATRTCPTGDPRLASTICGPLIDAANTERVENWIAEALSAGASLLAGGERSGNVLAPTLLEGVPYETSLGSEEAFGPVLTLETFEDLPQAIERVNRSPFGIHCGVFTQNPDRAGLAIQEVAAGGIVVNDSPSVRFDALPYGGVKQSGFGREGVRYAIEEMTEWKSVVRRR